MNISSLVVRCSFKNKENIIKSIENLQGCEYHYGDDSAKMVFTIEADEISKEIHILKQIQNINGVISADLIYSYSENELEQNMQVLDNGDCIPKMLNDKNIKAEDIIYNGDMSLNKKHI